VRTRRTEERTPEDGRATAPAPSTRPPEWLAAGNARVTAYLQRARVGWPDGVAINKDKKASKGFTRFPIGDLSSGLAESEDVKKAEAAGKGGQMKATEHTAEAPFNRGLVLVPTALLNQAPAEIDVFFHLHGHGIGWREGSKTADDKSAPAGFAFKDAVRDEVAEDIEGQLPPTIAAVMPQGGSFAQFGGIDANAVILEALHTVPGWGAVKPRRVVFGAYSGGGGTASGLLGSSEKKADDRLAERMKDLKGLSEVVLFDAINGPKEELPAAISFVGDQIDVDIARLSAEPDVDKQKEYLRSSMRFRGFFTAGSPRYNPLYTSLFEQTVRAKGLWTGTPDAQKHGTVPKALAGKISQPVWELLADNYVIAPRGQGHETKMAGGNLKEAMGALAPGAPPTYPA
jgi:hypothetical protein